MSECTGATTFSTDRSHKWGSCGFAMPGTEVIVLNTTTGQPVGPGAVQNPSLSRLFHLTCMRPCCLGCSTRSTAPSRGGARVRLRQFRVIQMEHVQAICVVPIRELCYRGRHVMMGYLANPLLGEEHVAEIEKKTAEAIDAEGWLHSADKGCVVPNPIHLHTQCLVRRPICSFVLFILSTIVFCGG